MISACSTFRRVKVVNLVVDVGDVHNKMDIIAKVIFEDTTEDILSDIVAKNCGVRVCQVFRVIFPTEHGPCALHRTPLAHNCTMLRDFRSWA